MTRAQIKWAAQHDWFIKATDNSVIVEEVCRTRDGEIIIDAQEFSDYTELRHWAGY